MPADRRARVGAVIDRTFGEEFELTPRTRPAGDPDARYQSDLTRAVFTFTGRFTSSGGDLNARGRATAIHTTRPIDAASPTVTVAIENLTGAVQEGDLLTRTKTGERFAVGKLPDGRFERLVLKLRPA